MSKKKGGPEGAAATNANPTANNNNTNANTKAASKAAKAKNRRKKKKEQLKAQQAQAAQGGGEGEGGEQLPEVQWTKPKKQKKQEEEAYESQSEEDYSDTQQERKNEYRKGGYHPVTEGELYNGRYRVVKKLGWGYFSTVWLCWDHDESNFKAIKIQKSAQHYREAAYDEITLLSQISGGDVDNTKCCCRLTDHFEHRGPHGRHVVMVFEVLGENLLQLIMKYDYKGIPIAVVKNITRQVLIGLDYLHRELKIIHTDLKPENVVVALPQKPVQKAMSTYVPPSDRHKQISLTERDPTTLSKAQKKRLRKKLKMQKKAEGADGNDSDSDDDEKAKPENGKAGDAPPPPAEEKAASEDDESHEESLRRYNHVKLVDFGNACWTHKHFTDDIQTRQYRAPEVIVRNHYETSVDIWSCACLVFELLTGDFLFDPQESEYIDRDEDHLALIVELLQTQAQVPSCLYAKGCNEYINSSGCLRHINHLKFWDLQSVLHEKYKYRAEKANEIASFLLPMLSIDPDRRASAEVMLKHPWLEPADDDWDPYTRDDQATPGSNPRAQKQAPVEHEEEWEDADSDEGDAPEPELPAGMTLEMYQYYLQQQMQHMHSTPEGHQHPVLYEQEVEDDDSDGPGSPVSQSAAVSPGDSDKERSDVAEDEVAPEPEEEKEAPEGDDEAAGGAAKAEEPAAAEQS